VRGRGVAGFSATSPFRQISRSREEVGSDEFAGTTRDRRAIVRAQYPITRDSDGDGTPDLVDTCLDLADPGQEDADADGMGNACNDADGDEFADALDNCPAAVAGDPS
jgi:hypothetical protein